MTDKLFSISEEMKQQQLEKIEQLKKQHLDAVCIDVWWDGESLFTTDKPKLKYKITEKNA